MTDEEKVMRLAAILGIEGEVQYGRYYGVGERSNKKGHREARLGSKSGDGATDAEALRSLVCRLERAAEHAPANVRSAASSLRSQSSSWRVSESVARTKAEGYEADANKRDAEAAALAAQLSAYIVDRGPESES